MASCDALRALRPVGLDPVDVQAVGPTQHAVDRRRQLGRPRLVRLRRRRRPRPGGQLRDAVERVHGEHVAGGVGDHGEVVAVHGVAVAGVAQAVEQSRRGPARAPQPGGHPGHRRVEAQRRGAVARRGVVAPQPLGVARREGGVVARPVAVGVHRVDPPVGPVAGLAAGHVAQPLPAHVLVAVRPHDCLGLVGRVPDELALLTGGRVDELLVAAVQARARVEAPDRVEHAVVGGERRAGDPGHGGMPGEGHHRTRAQRLARVVDLEVAEPEVGEGLEGLAPLPLNVGGREVRLLGPMQRRDLPVGIEQVARPQGDGAPRLPRRERHPRPRRVDGAEVRHDRAARHGVQAHRVDRRLHDAGPLGVRPAEGRAAGGADDASRATTRCRRSPRSTSPAAGPARPPIPRSRRRRRCAAATAATRPPARARCRSTRRPPGGRRGTRRRAGGAGPGRRRGAPARPVPTVQHADGAAPPARSPCRSGPRRARTARRGTRSWATRPPVRRPRTAGRCARRRRTRWHAVDGAGGRCHLGAQVGDAVGLLRVTGRPQPLGLPVAVAQRRGEARRRRHRSPAPTRPAGLDRPLVGRVGGEWRSRVGDEGLASRRHGAAVPCEPAVGRVGPADHDAGGRLCHVRARTPAGSRRTSSRRGRRRRGRRDR